MTYNFDPDKWHENEVALLQERLRKKQITPGQYDNLIQDLEQQLEKMWARLDGTYQVGKDGAP